MSQVIDPLKTDLTKLAGVLNQFKSEAVQVKLLDLILRGSPTLLAASPAPAKRRGRPPKVTTAADTPQAKPAKTRRKKRSKVGATSALHKLLESGFFKSRRTIADVADACQSKLGLDIAVTNLSGPLMRFVEAKMLVRAKNKEDKFEYWAK